MSVQTNLQIKIKINQADIKEFQDQIFDLDLWRRALKSLGQTILVCFESLFKECVNQCAANSLTISRQEIKLSKLKIDTDLDRVT